MSWSYKTLWVFVTAVVTVKTVIETLHWEWSERWIVTGKTVEAALNVGSQQHWTGLPYLSLLPPTHTSGAHTRRRDEIRQGQPSARYSWVIFLRTDRAKGSREASSTNSLSATIFRFFWDGTPDKKDCYQQMVGFLIISLQCCFDSPEAVGCLNCRPGICEPELMKMVPQEPMDSMNLLHEGTINSNGS